MTDKPTGDTGATDGTRGANRYEPDSKVGEPAPTTGDYCTTCGRVHGAESAFCGHCGARRS
jgi:uncharacterized OB-fold protein